ncbi:MAG TPA: TetR family transcriptional regulator C-terminal domain-containing protein [Mesorhizobium sp.]|jgi:TetR/AcrR family transcriptional regulator|nr:TetR family transcriptional regulator C-terminal domain-containing protein [Mesorhizobium sp.]
MDAISPKPPTRIQQEKRERILEAALDVFSAHGFGGATLDRIAQAAGMSKPNLLYYFRGKDDIYTALIERLLDRWLEPLRALDPQGDPLQEIRAYVRRKLEMSRDYPRESRLFAGEILAGAPRIMPLLEGELKELVDDKAMLLERWMAQGRLRAADPRHLIFSVWATTQHYADFDAQVRAVLGPEWSDEERFEAAARFLEALFAEGLRTR